MDGMNSCGTHRRVDNPDALLREARDKGCAIWLMLDPRCHAEALARLYEMEPDAEKTILFRDTALAESIDASPWLVPLSRDSPMERCHHPVRRWYPTKYPIWALPFCPLLL